MEGGSAMGSLSRAQLLRLVREVWHALDRSLVRSVRVARASTARGNGDEDMMVSAGRRCDVQAVHSVEVWRIACMGKGERSLKRRTELACSIGL